MSYLVDRKTELIFKTAAVLTEGGKPRSIVIESRPNYAIVKLSGTQTKYPIAWEHIFQLARDRHTENLRLEGKATRELEKALKPKRRNPGRSRRNRSAQATVPGEPATRFRSREGE